MRCIDCGAKRKGEPESFKFRCPSCGHEVAASKKRDKTTDGAIKAAIEGISGPSGFRFLPEHVGYELIRRAEKRAAKKKYFGPIGLGLVVLVFFLGDPFDILAGIAGVVLIVMWAVRKLGIPADPFTAVERFLNINPQPNAVTEDFSREPGDGEVQLALSSRQVLVCQRESYVRFLVANDFHLTHACPVVGPDGASTLFPGLIERLRGLDDVSVFVLHDLTPGGTRFVNSIRTSDQWFPDEDRSTVIDLGLNPGQEPLVDKVSRPLQAIQMAGAGTLAAGSGGKKPARGTEVTAMRPGRFMKTVAYSLGAAVPLILLSDAAAQAAVGRSDSGG